MRDVSPDLTILKFEGEPMVCDDHHPFETVYLIPDPRHQDEGFLRVMTCLFGAVVVHAAWQFYERRDFLRQLAAMEVR